jgi:hypothetical protein
MKVTFDKNVYEFVVDPEKPGPVDPSVRDNYRKIHGAILKGEIIPFISETILTYEVLKKDQRQNILSHTQPIMVTSGEGSIAIFSNPGIHPGNTAYEDHYLPKAITMGLKILPDRRFGKLINPHVKKEWYYIPDEDYFSRSARYGEILDLLEGLNVGYIQFKNLINTNDLGHLPVFTAVSMYSGSAKKLSAALSERSDGDSVALHITYEIDFFCTFDKGANAGRSVFNEQICTLLKDKYQFEKITPSGLAAQLS